MNAIRYFILGALEFRRSATTAPADNFLPAYEWGRECAHRLTLRRFED